MVELIVLIVLAVLVYLIYQGRKNPDLVEKLEDSDRLTVDEAIALNHWITLYKLVSFEEADGTKGKYIMDRKTHAVLAYILEDDGEIKFVKQQQGGK